MTERRAKRVLVPRRAWQPKKTKKSPPGGAERDEISTWVQCERKACLKWRRVSAQEAAQLADGQPWFCSMNPDARYDSCSARQEKASKPKHMKFVYSLLPLGELVMARMSGYPPWPGLLTSDPSCNEYYDAPLDNESEVTHYHVEFLGAARSHAWVVANLVHPLSSVPDADKCPQFKNIQGRKLIEIKKSFDKGLAEARRLEKRSLAQRLATCQFTMANGDEKIPDVTFTPEEEVELPVKRPRKRGKKRKNSQEMQHNETRREQRSPLRLGSPTISLTEQPDQLLDTVFPEISDSAPADCVPSSNPNSPLDLAVEFCSDSEEENSANSCCDVAERDLQCLETLLMALEPSLYPRSGEGGDPNKARLGPRTPVLLTTCRSIGPGEVDVTRTLNEIAEIEEEIAQLDTFVAIGLDQL